MKAWGQEILKEREQFWGGKEHVHGEAGSQGGVKSGIVQQQEEYYAKETDQEN